MEIPCINPFPNSTHAYLGPFLEGADSDELKEIFPSYGKHSFIVFTKGPYDLIYIDAKVFRSALKVDKVIYTNWLMGQKEERGSLEKIRDFRHDPVVKTWSKISTTRVSFHTLLLERFD